MSTPGKLLSSCRIFELQIVWYAAVSAFLKSQLMSFSVDPCWNVPWWPLSRSLSFTCTFKFLQKPLRNVEGRPAAGPPLNGMRPSWMHLCRRRYNGSKCQQGWLRCPAAEQPMRRQLQTWKTAETPRKPFRFFTCEHFCPQMLRLPKTGSDFRHCFCCMWC